jgi:transcriptional regulator
MNRENSFYIGDKFNHFKRANKKNVHILFEDKNITQYLKEHKVDFNSKDDLKALLQFCAG